MEEKDDFRPEAVVLAAGDYPSAPLPLALLAEAERVVCCDGAAAHYVKRTAREPWLVVGDGDSLPPLLRRRLGRHFVHYADQESNDLTKATLHLRRLGFERIAYVGATGGREDHTLGNISLLVRYMQWGLRVRMFTDRGTFRPCHHRFRAEGLRVGTQLSIFSFGAKGFRSQGLRYTLPSTMDSWWQGTLNETTAPLVTIEADGDFLLFVEY